MAATTLSIPSRPTLPWRIAVAGAALIVAGILVFSSMVGFSSSSPATTSKVSSSHAAVTPDSLDRVATPASSAGLAPDAVDRVSVPSSSDSDLHNCHPGKPC
jgi:hypothetical protein